MASVENSITEETKKAAAKMFEPEGEGEFEFHKIDEKIHRVPAGLSAITKSYSYIMPRLVAIGPYHHGKEHLKKMEVVKKAAAFYFFDAYSGDEEGAAERERNEAYKKVCFNVNVARGKYIMDETIIEGMKNDAYFAAMMFHDACFLLLYMDAYSRSNGKKEDFKMNESLRRFLFSKRDSIDNDIMLLENQLPWQVVQVLIDSVGKKEELVEVVGKFIAGMGNTFKICEDVELKPYDWKENRPPHLLALLRRYKTEPSDSDGRNSSHSAATSPATPPPESDDGRRCLPLLRTPWTQQTESNTQEEKTKVSSISAMSPMELEEIGIKLTASKKDAFSGMAFVEGHLWSELSLAALSLSDGRASCLVNMAAFEVCTASRFGDDANKTAVCSYLALLALFMNREEDVHKLRAMGILHGPQSNTEMLNFFKSVMKHLPDCGYNFTKIMVNIEDYKVRRYIWTTLYKWVYNHFWAILQVLSILGTLIALYQKIDSLNKKN